MIRERLTAVAALLGLAALAGWAADAAYFGPARSTEGEIASLTGELRSLQLRERRAEVELSGADATEAPAIDGLVDVSPDPAASAERLQEIVRNTVAMSGGQPISSQSAVSDLGGGFNKTTLLLRARFDEAGLLVFLRQIEGGSPVVLVEALDVQQLPFPGDVQSLDVTASLAGIHADVAAP